MNKNGGLPISSEEMNFWEEYGYVVVRNAVPLSNCRAAEKAVWEFAGMSPDDPETWYPDPPRGIMKEIYQHQALWDNRQHPKVHAAFAQIWGTEKLQVSRDRASINPPERPGYEYTGPWLHWDLNVDDVPDKIGVQGILYLTDTAADQGAFACVPGFHLTLREWLKSLPKTVDPREKVREEFSDRAVFAEGSAGDLVIWHTGLPHGSSPNRNIKPRIAQYVTMNPAPERRKKKDKEESERWWQQRLTGLGKNEKEIEHSEGKTAELTKLGRKLLGVDDW
tara:strand:+ start:3652 stop:4488 length:837 start_codon:yes stop_codon:yes gene_type:complete